jgi:hypothetical protein
MPNVMEQMSLHLLFGCNYNMLILNNLMVHSSWAANIKYFYRVKMED